MLALFDYLWEHHPDYKIGSSETSSPESDTRHIERWELTSPRGKKKVVYFDETAFYGKSEPPDVAAAKDALVTAIAKDERKPSKGDLSGSSASGRDLNGYYMHLQQQGKSVTGLGYGWGCTGTGPLFEINGTYKAGVLRLNFIESTAHQDWHTFKSAVDNQGIHLRDANGYQVIRPVNENARSGDAEKPAAQKHD